MIIIPVDSDPVEVTKALAKYVVDHSALTCRGYSGVSEQIKNRLSSHILAIVMEQHGGVAISEDVVHIIG